MILLLNHPAAVPPRPFGHKVLQFPVDFPQPASGRLLVWADVAVGQVPGNVAGSFASLPSLMVCELEHGPTSLPGLFLDLLVVYLLPIAMLLWRLILATLP